MVSAAASSSALLSTVFALTIWPCLLSLCTMRATNVFWALAALTILLASTSAAAQDADPKVADPAQGPLPEDDQIRPVGPQLPSGDCAEPTNANFANQLAEEADVVVSGLAVSMGPGSPVCAPAGSSSAAAVKGSGPDLLVQDGSQADGSQVLLFWAQCVHKGALVCRNNEADDSLTPPRCVIAVRIPAQSSVPGEKPPCNVTRGFRYTLLLSSKTLAGCDGVYDMQYSRITDSIRTHVGMQACVPYPVWPSQDTSTNSTGTLSNILGQSCQGTTAKTTAQCTGDSDPCTGKAACSEESAVSCIAKACVGKFLVGNTLIPTEPCGPVFMSKVTGWPVVSCSITDQRLNRQARQAEKRLSAGTKPLAASTGNSAPTRLGSVLGGGSRLGPLPSVEGGIQMPQDAGVSPAP